MSPVTDKIAPLYDEYIMNNGFTILKDFFCSEKLLKLEEVLIPFHARWKSKNTELYHDGAINSAYLTSKKTTSIDDRRVLFDFISSSEISAELAKIFKDSPRFLNTQLFFDPFNPSQKNYWHRDIQYTKLSIKDQQRVIQGTPNNVVHFRVPLNNEIGIELIPGSHNRWDNDLEYDIRNELNGSKKHDSITGSETVKLARGDLLIFSANMIHRGLYGDNRFALDILYCEDDPEILKYREKDSCPGDDEIFLLLNQSLFK